MLITYCFIISYHLFSCVASEPYMICFHGSAKKPQRKTGGLNTPGNHRRKSIVYRCNRGTTPGPTVDPVEGQYNRRRPLVF